MQLYIIFLTEQTNYDSEISLKATLEIYFFFFFIHKCKFEFLIMTHRLKIKTI